MTRYRVLSFFFDGVPPPPGLEEAPAEGAAGPTVAELEPAAGEAGPPPAATPPKPPPIRSRHAPYSDQSCSSCHSAQRSYQLLAAGAELCGKCHAPYFEFESSDWAHGPVAVGQCSVCHVGHESEYPALQTAPQPDLCFRCHDAAAVMGRPYHAAAQTQRCSTCHDPHASGNALLLADSRTYRRRKYAAGGGRSPHTVWDRKDCARCHVPERANKLVDDVNEVCLSCHDAVRRAPPGQKLHGAVQQGECTLCHTPHGSPLPHLIRPKGEAICYECHDPEEIRTRDHPRVYRANCLLCHAGHSSERAHLLRPGIPSTR